MLTSRSSCSSTFLVVYSTYPGHHFLIVLICYLFSQVERKIWLTSAGIGEDRVRWIFRQLIAAVQYVNVLKVLYQEDLLSWACFFSPANVLINEHGMILQTRVSGQPCVL